MLFNSIDFAIFLPIVFFLYWAVTKNNLKLQNLLIVVSSYIFYGWWDWRFLILIFITSSNDFFISKLLFKTIDTKLRKYLLTISIVVDLGILGFFKYFNFFQENFITAFKILGYQISGSSLNIILPVGISFYTFQSLSYTIDVYRRDLEPAKNLVDFLAFVSFFPQLVAGPIERSTNLLPQFYKKRSFNYKKAVDGTNQILWGFFKKIVIADNCAKFANMAFNNHANYGGSSLLIGVIFFAFQIYGDFSGYSDIAIGLSRLFGFNLKRNFAYPYFSRDIAEFWRRWHISLSTWFRDYLYIPLGGSRGGKLKNIRNTFIIFIVSGFWHGANWTFVFWGFLNALYFLPLLLSKANRKNIDIVAKDKLIPSVKEFLEIVATFSLTVLAWIFFRAENMKHAYLYIRTILSPSLFSKPSLLGSYSARTTFLLLILFVFIEWVGRKQEFAIQNISVIFKNSIVRFFAYAILMSIILMFMPVEGTTFIYFQF